VFSLPGDETLEALRGVDLAVGEREFVSLLGPSGCGKSTLLRLIADILKPTVGELQVLGRSPSEARQQRLFSFMAQDPVMLPWRTVIQNVHLPLEMMPEGKSLADRPAQLLELVGLQGFEDAAPGQLSGGMKQRAALARALLPNPRLLLMDEPFGALDEITRQQMNLELLRIWREIDAAVLFVTHSVDEAVFLSDKVVVMSSRPGQISAEVPIDLPRPRQPDVKQGEAMFHATAQVRKALNEAVPSLSV
jgi:NitT/TauT family transport system ATP-binding protein